jgi:hypothetical protein
MNIVLKKRIVLLLVVSLLILGACKPVSSPPTSVPTLAIPTETSNTSKLLFNRVYLEDELEYIYIDVSLTSSFAEELGKYPNITAISLRNATSIPVFRLK